jgi:hypothetical protein
MQNAVNQGKPYMMHTGRDIHSGQLDDAGRVVRAEMDGDRGFKRCAM